MVDPTVVNLGHTGESKSSSWEPSSQVGLCGPEQSHVKASMKKDSSAALRRGASTDGAPQRHRDVQRPNPAGVSLAISLVTP